MENTRQFTVVMSNKKDIKIANLVTATTKYHAIEIAMAKYPGHKQYQCNNIVRTRYYSQPSR